VIEIEMAAVDNAPADAFANIKVADFNTAFKLRRGFRGQYLAQYGERTVTVLTHDWKEVLTSSSVTLGPQHRVGRVSLTVPPPH
jgi:hypothetical protein